MKFRLMRQIAMKLVYIQLECLLKDRMLSMKKMSRDITATFVTRDFLDFSFPQQLAFWLIFQPRLKCNYGPFWHFPYCTLFTEEIQDFKIFVQLSALCRKFPSPLKLFATSSFWNIFIFESSWLSIPATFRLKVAEKLSWLF